MPNYFRVKDLPGFEGLIAKTADDEQIEDYENLLYIDAFFNTDDNTTVDLPKESVCISAKFLEQVSFSDFAQMVEVEKHTPSFNDLAGDYLYEGTFVKDLLNITYTMYKKAVSITIFEMANRGQNQHTLYTQNFFDERNSAMIIVEKILKGDVDPDDLVFLLKDLKNSELNGDK